MSQIHLSENSQIKTTEDSNVYRGELVFDEYSQDLGVATRDNINEPLYYVLGGGSEIKKILTNYTNTDLDFSVDSHNSFPVFLKKSDSTPLLLKENDSTFFNSDSIKGWSNLKSVASNQIGIFGLKENGKIIYSSSCINFNQDWVQKFLKENEFEKILASARHIAGLTKDGILRCIDIPYTETNDINDSNSFFFMHKFNPEESSHNLYNGIWDDEDIIDFQIGYGYIVGIKSNKTIKVIGSLNDNDYNKNILGMENDGYLMLEDTEVANWTNVDKLVSNHTGLISISNNKVNHIYIDNHVYNREEIIKEVSSWDDIVDATIGEVSDGALLTNIMNEYQTRIVIVGVKKDGTCISSSSGYPRMSLPEVKTFTNVIEASSSYYGIYLKRSKPVRTTYDMFKEQIKERLMGYSPEDADFNSKIFGIRVDMNNADSDAACTYTDACCTMTPMYVDGIYSENLHQGSWTDEFMQKLIGCRPCILEWTPSDDDNAQDTHVLGYLDPNDYTRWIDGRPTELLDIDTCMGINETINVDSVKKLYNKSVMIEFDKIYYYIRVDKINNVAYIKYSKTKHNNDWHCHPAFMRYENPDGTGNVIEVDHLYISAYTAGRVDFGSPIYHNMSNPTSDPMNIYLNGATQCTTTYMLSYPNMLSSNVCLVRDINHTADYDSIRTTLNNGYKSVIQTGDRNRWQCFDYSSYMFLVDMLRIMCKNYNLWYTNLLNSNLYNFPTDISDKINYYNANNIVTMNNGISTYNKGLFWKGNINSGLMVNVGAINPPNNKLFNTNVTTITDTNLSYTGIKLFGIDSFLLQYMSMIEGLMIDLTKDLKTGLSKNDITQMRYKLLPPYHNTDNYDVYTFSNSLDVYGTHNNIYQSNSSMAVYFNTLKCDNYIIHPDNTEQCTWVNNALGIRYYFQFRDNNITANTEDTTGKNRFMYPIVLNTNTILNNDINNYYANTVHFFRENQILDKPIFDGNRAPQNSSCYIQYK